MVHLDLPGASADSIDLTVEQNVLTIHAERKPPVGDGAERVVDERRYGVFSRQLFLGDTLDSDRLTADYDAGVLTLRIPIAEKAKPRKVEIAAGESGGRSTPPNRWAFDLASRQGSPWREVDAARARMLRLGFPPRHSLQVLVGCSATASRPRVGEVA